MRRVSHICRRSLWAVAVCVGLWWCAPAAAQTYPTVYFASASYNAYENDGLVKLTVLMSKAYTDVVTVQYTTADPSFGTKASAAEDYVPQNGTLIFAPGETEQHIYVSILPDTKTESTEQSAVVLSNPSPSGVLLSTNPANVFINDGNRPAPSVAFVAATFSFNEYNDPIATISVKLTGKATGQVTVTYSVGGGSATVGADYISPPNGTLTWAHGEEDSIKTFTIGVVDDIEVESQESVNLGLALVSGTTNVTLGTQSTAVLYIDDDDEPCPP